MIGAQTAFEDMGAPLFAVPFCVLDLETTGATPADCEITEVGAVKYEGGELVGTFHTLVDPGMEIPPTITILTGITQAMVINAPRIAEVLPAFLEFIGDAVIVGHNVRFDMSFLNAAALRLGYGRLPNRTADTMALSRRLVREEVRSLGLATLAAHFRSPTKPIHRALDDAKATAHVFFELLERAGSLGVTHLEDLMRLPTARGRPHYDKLELTDGLPRLPGVYIFRDRDDEPIYVGKAKNLRTRVRAYFYGDTRKTVSQMLRNLVRIEHRVCANELEAEVAELRLIHAYRPRYNRRSRPPKSSHWVKLTSEQFPRLSLVRTVRPGALGYLGPFRSRRRAELVMTAVWDAAPIRRCIGKNGQTSAACHFSQLGVAVCPCTGELSEADYRPVVDQVLLGMTTDPEVLLAPLAAKMLDKARAQRFEEAATVRDRYRALAHAVETRRVWSALQHSGALSAEDESGDGIHLEGGRLIAAWSAPDPPPLFQIHQTPIEDAGVPPSVGAAEEASLVWRWLNRPGVRILDSARPVAWPVNRLEELEARAS